MAAIKHNQCCSRYTADNALKTRVLSSMSVAMKRHEDRYLQALQTFSRPARELWQVTAIDEVRMDAGFKGEPEIYRLMGLFGLARLRRQTHSQIRLQGTHSKRWQLSNW